MSVLSSYPDLVPNALNEMLLEGGACFNNGDLDDAVSIFNEILTINPSDVQAQSNLGMTYRQMGCHGQALACLRKAHELAPDSRIIVFNLATLYEATGLYNDAFNLCAAYLDKHPEDKELNSIKNRLVKSIEAVNTSKKDELALEMIVTAEGYGSEDRINNALALFDAVLAVDASKTLIHRVHCNMAGLYRRLGNTEKRIQHLMAAFGTDSTDKAIVLELGEELLEAGQYENVTHVIETYLLFSPNDEDVAPLGNMAYQALSV